MTDPADDHELDIDTKYLADSSNNSRFARRNALPAIEDDGSPKPPALPVQSPQTYTAVTFSTPDAVFAKGYGDPPSLGRSSTQSTIVCGENNWESHVDWETTSMTSGLSTRSGTTSDNPGDTGQSLVENRGSSHHPRHHSMAGRMPGFQSQHPLLENHANASPSVDTPPDPTPARGA
ncbi:hypothetical protein IMZ48_05585, partial [Candidatus Bathyarchaeota archaeon]|nr:hypothetical protein [Candidatus Bathyarchaeota archaeon]